MPERVLCEDGLRVAMDGGGDRTLLVVNDGVAIRFWAKTRSLEAILGGGTVQLSAHEGYCGIEVEGERARLEFGVEKAGRKHCQFPTQDLSDALAWVRSLPPPDANGDPS